MTVQNLFQSIDEEEFLRYYMTHEEYAADLLYCANGDFPRIEKLKNLVRETLAIFKTREVEDNPNDIYFVLPYGLTDEKDYSFFCSRKEIFTEASPEHYSIEEVEWNKALGSTLSHISYFKYDNKVEIAYELFNALTYLGFDEEGRSKNIEQLFQDIKEALEDIEGTITDYKETLEELGIDNFDAYSDPFDEEYYKLEAAYRKDMLNLFISHERAWLKELEESNL